MKIRNNKNKANYLNFKAGGANKKILIPAGKTADVIGLNDLKHVVNLGDFDRGFFEVIEVIEVIEVVKIEKKAVEKVVKKALKKKEEKKEEEDSFEKIEKEVKAYTSNEE